MSHQPPVPEGSQSPYPLQPAPIPEAVKQQAERETGEAAGEATGASQGTLFGIGAAVALGAAAALGGLFYARRASAGVKAKRSGGKKRQSGRAKAGRKIATGETRH